MGEAKRRRAAIAQTNSPFTPVVFLPDKHGQLAAGRPAPPAIDIIVERQEMLQHDRRGERVMASVPCGGCYSCCHAHVQVNEAEERPDDFAHLDLVRDGSALALRRRPDGSCVHLDEAGRCSIYAARPKTCRQYDCRIHATCGLRHAFDPSHAAPPWVLAQNTKGDRTLFAALVTYANSYIQQRGTGRAIDEVTDYAWMACRDLAMRLFPEKVRRLQTLDPSDR
jgi:hypothetical protein